MEQGTRERPGANHVAAPRIGRQLMESMWPLEAAKEFGDSDQPTMITAHTTKGKGVQVTEGKYEWHSKIATEAELKVIAAELGIEEVVA